MKATCSGSIWGAHKFSPRYDQTEIPELIKLMQQAESLTIPGGRMLSDHVCRQVYVKDICVRCGAVVERNS